VTRVLAVDGSPQGGGRTRTAIDAVLAGAASAGAQTATTSLADGRDVLPELRQADAFVIASPVYRASFAAPLKTFLDQLPRGKWGEKEQPITARAVAIVLTGATWHHYLALDELRSVLAGFFGAHVLTPGLYVPGEGFDASKRLVTSFAELARGQGTALVALAQAIAASAALQAVGPHA
jgi:FMN reductase